MSVAEDTGLEAPATLGGYRLALAMVAVFASVCCGALASIALPRQGMLAPVWIANAFVLTALILTEKKAWTFLMLAAVEANAVAQGLGHSHLTTTGLCMIACNVVECVVAAAVFRRVSGGRIDFEQSRALVQLSAACIAGVGVSSLLSASLLTFLSGAAFAANVVTWSMAHSLGLLTLTPCLMIVLQPKRYLNGVLNARTAAAAITLVGVTAAVFCQNRFPILFLIPPALLLVSLELGTFGAGAGVLTVEAVALISMFTRTGPMMLIHGDPVEKAAVIQIFLCTALMTSVPVAVLNARRKQSAANAMRSELMYRQLAENAIDMIARFKPDGEITFITPSCLQVLGYEPHEILGSRALEFAHPDDLEVVRDYYKALRLSDGTLPHMLQFRMQRRDGVWIWLEGRPKMFIDPITGEAQEMQDVVRDVTSRKELEFLLAAAEAEALTASRVKSEFLSNMSHELRTPLTSIIGFSNLLQNEKGMGPEGLRALSRIANSSHALMSLVNDILDFSKLEAGQVDLDVQEVDLRALILGTLGMLEPQAELKHLSLKFCGDTLPEIGILDETRLRQILTNLISNAIKFTKEGSVTVSASVQDERLRCEIADTGEGIAGEGLERLFQRFSQVDASTTRNHGGTGLGLAICKGLVDAMNGSIGAQSQVGLGSVFWFEIPCPEGIRRVARVTDGEPGPSLHGLRLLVADDNAVNREIVQLMLAPKGVEVTMAASGEEAVRLAHELPFDIILMDLRMGTMDGRTAALSIRTGGGPNDMVPILAFTADLSDVQALTAPGSPFSDSVHKPIAIDQFLGKLSHWAFADDAPMLLEALHG